MLKLAGYINLLISLAHFTALFFLDEALRLTGVSDRMAMHAALHPCLPWVITFIVACAFAIFGIYALAGAGLVKIKLPFLKPFLYAIGAIYILRGLAGVVFRYTDEIPGSWQLLFALAALGIGMLYVVGTYAAGKVNRI